MGTTLAGKLFRNCEEQGHQSSFSDQLVSAAIGKTRFLGVNYNTVAQNITGLLAPGSDGVNHGELDWLSSN
jgi:hypothetical protein